jgi:DNA-binding IclR family transcriptional regulator
MKPDRPSSGVLERALTILACFTQNTPRLQLREVAAASGLDKATALRALKTLTDWGYLEKSPDGSYSPGPANLRLAAIFRTTSSVTSRLEAPIVRISERVRQTTSFFVRSQDSRVCLARDYAYRDFRFFIEVGASVPLAEGGAAARVLRAITEEDAPFRDQIWAEGYYISRGERNKHLASVGVPIFETDGAFLGAMTMTGLAAELDDETLVGFVEIVREEVATVGFLTRSAATAAKGVVR